MRAERPQRVLVGPQLAEVQPVPVDVQDPAEVAAVDELLELDDARVVLEQVADHQHAIRGSRRGDDRLGVGHGLRHRLFHEAVLARRQDALRERGVRRHGRGEDDGVERVVGEHLVQIVR